jgi:hypothetical protein
MEKTRRLQKTAGLKTRNVRTGSGRGALVHSLGEAGDLPGSIFPVDHVLGSRLVKNGHGRVQSSLGRFLILLFHSGPDGLDHVFDSGSHGPVSGPALQTLSVPLQGRLMIGQGYFPPSEMTEHF